MSFYTLLANAIVQKINNKKHLITMFGIGIALAYLIAKKLDNLGDYKEPKGKYKNRYR